MRRIPALAAVLALALAGCGSEQSDLGATAGRLFQALKSRAGGGAAPAPPVSRAQIAGFTDPLLYGRIPSRGADSFLGLAAEGGPYHTWISPDGISLTLRDGGVLVATRGLGEDLVAAEVPAIRGPGGAALRRHRYLGGDERLTEVTFRCRIEPAGRETIEVLERRYATRRVAETCRSGARRFRNDYWLGNQGDIRQSRQWISDSVGFIILQRVVD